MYILLRRYYEHPRKNDLQSQNSTCSCIFLYGLYVNGGQKPIWSSSPTPKSIKEVKSPFTTSGWRALSPTSKCRGGQKPLVKSATADIVDWGPVSYRNSIFRYTKRGTVYGHC